MGYFLKQHCAESSRVHLALAQEHFLKKEVKICKTRASVFVFFHKKEKKSVSCDVCLLETWWCNVLGLLTGNTCLRLFPHVLLKIKKMNKLSIIWKFKATESSSKSIFLSTNHFSLLSFILPSVYPWYLKHWFTSGVLPVSRFPSLSQGVRVPGAARSTRPRWNEEKERWKRGWDNREE